MKEKKENKKRIINTSAINPKNDKKMILFYITISLFIIITILVLTKLTNQLDENIASYIIGIQSTKLTKIMTDITNIGRAYSLIAISLLLLFLIKDKRKPVMIIINLVSVFLISQIFKLIFRRPRPNGIFLAYATGYSYPSGHAMVSIAYFTFIAYLLCHIIKRKSLKLLTILLTSILICLIGFSRLYLGVHYFTDIIAGFSLGIAYLMIYLKIINSVKEKA